MESSIMKRKTIDLIKLHIFLMLSSAFGMCSKLAAQEDFLSWKFILFYSVVLCNLGIYAIVWQQLIKRLPLTTAYANKAVGVVWGGIYGYLFFDEAITVQKVLGSIVIIVGIVLFVTEKESQYD